jgi:formate hydrogenlyase transcriptional activator
MTPPQLTTLTQAEERLRFETLIADLSSRLINLPASEVDREIMDAERRLCAALNLDFSVLWQWSDATPGCFELTHFYSALEGPQPPARMKQDQYPWAREQLMAGRIIAISSPEELPAEAARDRATLGLFGIKSNLAIPLMVGGEPPIGVLGLGTLRTERDWPEALVARLQLVAQSFANALARTRADQHLRESEDRLSLAVDSAEGGIWEMDLRSQSFWASDKARDLFGYSPQERIDLERLRAAIHPDDWEVVRQSLERCQRLGERLNVEYRIRRGDGGERWIASRGRAFFNVQGGRTVCWGSPWT